LPLLLPACLPVRVRVCVCVPLCACVRGRCESLIITVGRPVAYATVRGGTRVNGKPTKTQLRRSRVRFVGLSAPAARSVSLSVGVLSGHGSRRSDAHVCCSVACYKFGCVGTTLMTMMTPPWIITRPSSCAVVNPILLTVMLPLGHATLSRRS
jgi:hypothetical protein